MLKLKINSFDELKFFVKAKKKIVDEIVKKQPKGDESNKSPLEASKVLGECLTFIESIEKLPENQNVGKFGSHVISKYNYKSLNNIDEEFAVVDSNVGGKSQPNYLKLATRLKERVEDILYPDARQLLLQYIDEKIALISTNASQGNETASTVGTTLSNEPTASDLTNNKVKTGEEEAIEKLRESKTTIEKIIPRESGYKSGKNISKFGESVIAKNSKRESDIVKTMLGECDKKISSNLEEKNHLDLAIQVNAAIDIIIENIKKDRETTQKKLIDGETAGHIFNAILAIFALVGVILLVINFNEIINFLEGLGLFLDEEGEFNVDVFLYCVDKLSFVIAFIIMLIVWGTKNKTLRKRFKGYLDNKDYKNWDEAKIGESINGAVGAINNNINNIIETIKTEYKRFGDEIKNWICTLLDISEEKGEISVEKIIEENEKIKHVLKCSAGKLQEADKLLTHFMTTSIYDSSLSDESETDATKKAKNCKKEQFFVFLSAVSDKKEKNGKKVKDTNGKDIKTLEFRAAQKLKEELKKKGIGVYWWEDVCKETDWFHATQIATGLALSSILFGFGFDEVTGNTYDCLLPGNSRYSKNVAYEFNTFMKMRVDLGEEIKTDKIGEKTDADFTGFKKECFTHKFISKIFTKEDLPIRKEMRFFTYESLEKNYSSYGDDCKYFDGASGHIVAMNKDADFKNKSDEDKIDAIVKKALEELYSIMGELTSNDYKTHASLGDYWYNNDIVEKVNFAKAIGYYADEEGGNDKAQAFRLLSRTDRKTLFAKHKKAVNNKIDKGETNKEIEEFLYGKYVKSLASSVEVNNVTE